MAKLFFFSPPWMHMKGGCSIVQFPIVIHHIFFSIKMSIHFKWCLQLQVNEDFFKLDDILIEISQQTTMQVLMFWTCTYSEMILGGLLLLQFKPSHENSIGTHGSPCQFLVTLYRSLISMIASTIVFNGKKEFIDDHSKRKWEREEGEL